MSKALNASLKLILDSAALEKGAIASRAELRELRRAMREIEDPMDRIEKKAQSFGSALEKSGTTGADAALMVDQYRNALIEKSPAGKAAKAEETQREREAAEVRQRAMASVESTMRSLETTEERLIRQENEFAENLRRSGLSVDEQSARLERYRNHLAATGPEAQRLAAEEREAATERQRALSVVDSTLKSIETAEERQIRQEREFEQALRRSGLSAEEQASRLERYRNHLAATSPEAQRMANEQRELEQAQRRYASVLQQMEGPNERSQRQLREFAAAMQAARVPAAEQAIQLERYRQHIQGVTVENNRLHDSLLNVSPQYSRLTQLLTVGGPALLGAAAGVAALRMAYGTLAAAVEFTYDRMQKIDQANDRAKVIGVDLAELRSLQFAADLGAGMEAEASAASMEKFTRNLAEAAAGGGKAKDAIDRLGLSAKDLQRMGSVDAIKTIADEFAKVETPGERAALAAKIFGKEGAAMGALLAEGSAGVQELIDDFERLGGSLSSLEAERIAYVNDQVTRMGVTVGALSDRAVLGLAEAFGALSMSMMEVDGGVPSLGAKFERFFVNMGGNLATIKGAAGDFITVMRGMNPNEWMAGTGPSMEDIANAASGKGARDARQEYVDNILKLETEAAAAAGRRQGAGLAGAAAEEFVDRQNKFADGIEREIEAREKQIRVMQGTDLAYEAEKMRIEGLAAGLSEDEVQNKIDKLIELQNKLDAMRTEEDRRRQSEQDRAAKLRAIDDEERQYEQERKRDAEQHKNEINNALAQIKTPGEKLLEDEAKFKKWLDDREIDELQFEKLMQRARDAAHVNIRTSVDGMMAGSAAEVANIAEMREAMRLKAEEKARGSAGAAAGKKNPGGNENQPTGTQPENSPETLTGLLAAVERLITAVNQSGGNIVDAVKEIEPIEVDAA